MGNDHAADIDKHVRTYLIVFVSLAVLTVVTVAVYYLHLSVVPAVVLALIIASVKASLVACYFMHMLTEKKLIMWILALTVAFFFVLLFLPVMTSVADQAGS